MAYLVQHGEKERLPGDPGLTQAGRAQAIRAGQWLRDQGIRTLYSSPMRRAQGNRRRHRVGDRAGDPDRREAAGAPELGRPRVLRRVPGPVGPHHGRPRLHARPSR
ncbi:MAG: phosphoglycerate mutase family protein [Streptosporangiaceae bacterium]